MAGIDATSVSTAGDGPRIAIEDDGPYVVSGGVLLTTRMPVLNEEGEPVAWSAHQAIPTPDTYYLCRCGHSRTKPFCDESHLAGFDGACTADRAPGATRRKEYRGVGITMTDDESLCAGYAYCDRHGGVWRTIAATADPHVREEVITQIANCPSGRLQYVPDGRDAPEEAPHAPAIAAIRDGALWLLGGVPLTTPDGFTYEVRARQLLCRCGESANKPFCDGTHQRIGFETP